MGTEDSSGLNIDPTPLPGVKANDPDTGAADSDKSDEEVAEELAEDPELDSGDDPEAKIMEDEGVVDVAFNPFHPDRIDNPASEGDDPISP